ncbi:hypothetical protein Poly30_27730 [Planctomycetes bacterium Poly30]|uniref:Uncharacterized protein n=1 Tax=Saltatorellus ferox TaxID=2528018 RepID=A0A518ET34_9BACT|nr:hypothetical protein Poly30_27730 [Planctomycetes bacterium Poly30]
MSPEARLAEVAEILVRGYRRLELVRQNGLDDVGQDERACGRTVVDAVPNSKRTA